MALLRFLDTVLAHYVNGFVRWSSDMDARSKAGEFGKWPWQERPGLWPWQRR